MVLNMNKHVIETAPIENAWQDAMLIRFSGFYFAL
jgi:hypothetical protein